MHAKPLHARVAEVERLAAQDPPRYRRRLGALVVTGIIVYALLLALALAVFVLPLLHGRIHGVLLVAGGAALYGLLAALFVRGDARSGPTFPLTRAQAPGLWARLDDLCARLDTLSVEEATLDLEFNAAVARRARFLLWGRGRTELRLGLPLVLLCDPDELASILAHELAHHRAGHAHANVRTLRVAIAMEEAAQRFARQGGLASYIILPVASWYVPKLSLMVLPVQRQYEREADRAQATVGLGAAGARALARMEVLTPWFVRAFLPHRPSFASLRAGMERTLEPESVARKLREALVGSAPPDDEHPPFAERLHLLGAPGPDGDGDALDRLTRAAAIAAPERAWTTLFAPDFREGVEAVTDDVFALSWSDASAAGVPPRIVESARQLAARGDESAAKAAYGMIVRDPTIGPIARLEALRALLDDDPDCPVAQGARQAIVNDPFVGLDARIDGARLLVERFHSGEEGVTEAMVNSAAASVEMEINLRRTLVGTLHNDPAGHMLEPIALPSDLSRELAERLESLGRARRAWAFWGAHRTMPGIRLPCC